MERDDDWLSAGCRMKTSVSSKFCDLRPSPFLRPPRHAISPLLFSSAALRNDDASHAGARVEGRRPGQRPLVQRALVPALPAVRQLRVDLRLSSRDHLRNSQHGYSCKDAYVPRASSPRTPRPCRRRPCSRRWRPGRPPPPAARPSGSTASAAAAPRCPRISGRQTAARR